MKTTALLTLLAFTLLFAGCANPVAVGPASGIHSQSPHNGNSEGTRPDLTLHR